MKLINENVLVFGLNASEKLTQEVCDALQVQMQKVERTRFSDGEVLVRPLVSVRNHDVVVVQSTSSPVNDNLVELLIFIDALKRASAKTIYCVCPYFGYCRQDRKVLPRQPISAKLMADLLVAAGTKRFTSFDLHSSQIQAFFSVPVDDLECWLVLSKHIKFQSNSVIISPDKGGINKARGIAELMNLPLAMLDKRRPRPNVAAISNILGANWVENGHCVIFDDIVDTANTMVEGIKALKKAGASKITIAASHAILSKDAIKNLQNSPVDEIYITNTIHWDKEILPSKFKIISISTFLAEVINALTSYTSVSTIVKNHKTHIKQLI